MLVGLVWGCSWLSRRAVANRSCPVGPPADGERCGLIDLECEYAGSPCGQSARCDGGRWTVQTHCPESPTCPEQEPIDGDLCDSGSPVAPPLSCAYGTCPEGTLRGPTALAECNGTTWTVTPRTCEPAILCGECPPGRDCSPGCIQSCAHNLCAAANVCMQTHLSADEWVWDCAVNSCAPDELSCDCLAPGCSQRGLPGAWVCSQLDDVSVECRCEGPEC